ncbi:MAG TPA: PAS domain S-box protein [Terriglobia bacterium]|nr:PAS domain S-box protein [Terriglobia bacterium]
MSTVRTPILQARFRSPVPNRLNPPGPAHAVQFYKDEEFLLDLLSRFIGTALGAGESAVVISTKPHVEGLEMRLAARGLDIGVIHETGRYIVLDAAKTLSDFMVNGLPDALRFADVVGTQIARAGANAQVQDGAVALFGEMVALLWASGKHEAAIELEKLWNDLGQKYRFHLRCAYPLADFNRTDDTGLFLKICAEHSSVIPGEGYAALSSEDERLRSIAELQQKAQALDFEIELRHSEERFRVLVESVKDYAIFMLDPEGRVTTWNAGAERIKGYKESEIIGKHFSVFYPAEDVQAGKPDVGLKTAVKDGRFEGEGWRVRKDGSRFWASAILTALCDQFGNLKGFAKVTRDITDRKRLEDSLRELSSKLLSLQDEERRRLARDLHDSTAQILTGLSLNLALLDRYTDLAQHPEASKALADSLSLAEQASREIRTISYLLHPPLLDEAGLAQALRWYIDGFRQRTNISVDFQVSDQLGRLPHDMEIALFRIAQECLTNVYRHSGSQIAAVRLKRKPTGISLSVSDQGKGVPESTSTGQSPPPASFGVGLRGMAERVRQLGGSMAVKPGRPGTVVEVDLPLTRSRVP